jgi:hypothetical protein
MSVVLDCCWDFTGIASDDLAGPMDAGADHLSNLLSRMPDREQAEHLLELVHCEVGFQA